MDTPINPPPPIGRRVPRVRHVGASIEAPARAGLGADLVAVAEERPDGLRPAVVAWVMLLRCVFCQSQLNTSDPRYRSLQLIRLQCNSNQSAKT